MTTTYTTTDIMEALNLTSRQALPIIRDYLAANHYPKMRQGRLFTLSGEMYHDLLTVARVSLQCGLSVQHIYALRAGHLESLRAFLDLPAPATHPDRTALTHPGHQEVIAAINEVSTTVTQRLTEVLEATRGIPRPISITPPKTSD